MIAKNMFGLGFYTAEHAKNTTIALIAMACANWIRDLPERKFSVFILANNDFDVDVESKQQYPSFCQYFKDTPGTDVDKAIAIFKDSYTEAVTKQWTVTMLASTIKGKIQDMEIQLRYVSSIRNVPTKAQKDHQRLVDRCSIIQQVSILTSIHVFLQPLQPTSTYHIRIRGVLFTDGDNSRCC